MEDGGVQVADTLSVAIFENTIAVGGRQEDVSNITFGRVVCVPVLAVVAVPHKFPKPSAR